MVTPSISDRIRTLAAQGHSRADIARMIDRSYQQVRQVLVADEARRRRQGAEPPWQAPGVAEPASAHYEAANGNSLPARLSVDRAGRVQLPPQWAVPPGAVFIARNFGGSIVLMNVADASRAARDGRPIDSASDELIAERRLEAMREFDD